MLQPLSKVDLRHLLYEVNLKLFDLLGDLTPEQWQLPTVCGPWTVKDVVAHLWGGDMGRLSAGRDGYFRPNVPINSYAELVSWIDQQNAQWVESTQRLSPKLLLNFITDSNQQLYHYLLDCDLDAPSIGVAWAGEMSSPLWFDIGREYTEKWMHFQHVCEAVGSDEATKSKWMHPALDIFMRGMPHAYRDSAAASGTQIQVNISGDAGGSWVLQSQNDSWQLFTGASTHASTTVSLTQDTAWRLFTNGLSAEKANPLIQIDGEQSLGLPFLNLIAIMA